MREWETKNRERIKENEMCLSENERMREWERKRNKEKEENKGKC
jgi:hypothetical protein